MSVRYDSWYSAYDKLTHRAWRISSQIDANRYTLCQPLTARRHYDGQFIGNATVTCLWCMTAW